MRLGETGLKISDYLDAVEDEILRDSVGQIYYKNGDGHIISTGKAIRTNNMVSYILDRFQVEEINMEANIYIFPGHPIEISEFIDSKIKIPKEELEDAKCVLFCDTLSSKGEDEASITTSSEIRDITLMIEDSEATYQTETLCDFINPLKSSSTHCTITATSVSKLNKFDYEYLIGIYLLILKGV